MTWEASTKWTYKKRGRTKVEDEEQWESNIKDLNTILDTLKLEKDNLHVEVYSLKEEVNSRDGRIEHVNTHLNQLHMEHVQLIAGMDEAQKQVEELKSKAKQLEEEVERQKTVILDDPPFPFRP